MARTSSRCDRDQPMLLPADLREWLADDHLAWFVFDAVAEMNLERLLRRLPARRLGSRRPRPRDDGRAAALRLRGRRALLAADRAPLLRGHRLPGDRRQPGARPHDDRPLSRPPRRRAGRALRRGTGPLRARPAWSRSARSPSTAPGSPPTPPIGRTAPTSSSAKEILEEAAEVDAAEDEKFGDKRGDELPGDRQSRRQRLRDAKRRLDDEHEAKQAEMAAWEVAMAEHTARTGYVKQEQPDQAAPDPAQGGPAHQRHRPRLAAGQDSPRLHPGLHRPGRGNRRAGDRRRRVDHRRQRAPPPRANGEGRRGRAHQGRGDREARARPRRRRLLERRLRSTSSSAAEPGSSARPTPTAARHRRRSDRAPTSSDAKAASTTRGRGGLPAKTADGRAGLRPDQVATEGRAVLTARVIRVSRRVASDGGDPQPPEALSGRFESSGGLIGTLGLSQQRWEAALWPAMKKGLRW